jgi:hypothetical protein
MKIQTCFLCLLTWLAEGKSAIPLLLTNWCVMMPNTDERNQAVGMLCSGFPIQITANHFNCHQNTAVPLDGTRSATEENIWISRIKFIFYLFALHFRSVHLCVNYIIENLKSTMFLIPTFSSKHNYVNAKIIHYVISPFHPYVCLPQACPLM